jgi:hypothetical protein
MSNELSVIIENVLYIAMFFVCFFGAYSNYKKANVLPGAGMVALGFVMYGTYALLACTGPGFTGSFFRDFSKLGVLNSDNFVYFISFALRLGIIPIIIGIHKLRSRKTQPRENSLILVGCS